LYAVSRGDEAGAERFQARMVAVREIFLENDIWPLIDCEMVLY
jgi:hypothetical protein